MAGATLVHHSSYFIFQDQDIRRRFHYGRPHLTDDLSIISLAPSVGNDCSSTHNCRVLFHPVQRSRRNPPLAKTLLHWRCKSSRSQPWWKNLPGKTKRDEVVAATGIEPNRRQRRRRSRQ